MVDKPAQFCACRLEGMAGLLCDKVIEQVCVNQCSGHGSCHSGYCRCHQGYYGHDCAQRRAGVSARPGGWRRLVLLPGAGAGCCAAGAASWVILRSLVRS
jgi:hypothetical protein